MKKFADFYRGKTVCDDGDFCESAAFKSLYRRFKNALNREFSDFEIKSYGGAVEVDRHSHTPSYTTYSLCGILEKEGFPIYFSLKIPRNGSPVDTKCEESILYRTAEESCLLEENNHFCSIEDFGESIRNLQETEKRRGSMKNFIQRYNGRLFPSNKPSSSENFGMFAIRFRYALQEVLPDFFIQDFTKNESSLSGVLEKDGVLVGFSWNMQENELINTRDDSPERGVTLQTNSGYEVCCSVEGIAEAVRSLQEKEIVLKEPDENNLAEMEER